MSTAVCPYCRMTVECGDGECANGNVSGGEAAVWDCVRCPACNTPHHRDCWDENGGCTVFGCSAAPVEEATVHVSASELHGAPASHGVSAHHGVHSGADDSTGVAPPPPVAGDSGTADDSASGDPNSQPIPLSHISHHGAAERKIYVLLAVICGFLGAHNLYANRTSAGIIQLCTTTLTCFLALPVTWIWALVEAATVEQDGDGFPMT